MPDLGPLGHSRPAHRVHGWCSHCPGRTVAEELAAWQVREDTPALTPPPADVRADVQGRCPACHAASLFLGSGGYVTCARLECPEPDAASTLLEKQADPDRRDTELQQLRDQVARVRGAVADMHGTAGARHWARWLDTVLNAAPDQPARDQEQP